MGDKRGYFCREGGIAIRQMTGEFMDLRIAIVEDEAVIRDELRRMLLRWEEKKIRQYDIFTRDFRTGGEFLNSGEQFDIIFLDIELEEPESGLKAAQELVRRGDRAAIVFLTSHKEKVFYGYTVRALNFLVKPVKEAEITWCMEQVTDKISDQYFVHNGHNNFKVRYHDILYMKANGHYITIETASGEYEIMSSLKQLILKLPEEFIQCHRTYIVNINQAVSIQKNRIILSNGHRIELGDKYKDDVFQLYMKKL